MGEVGRNPNGVEEIDDPNKKGENKKVQEYSAWNS
jgi:hypothetical protein